MTRFRKDRDGTDGIEVAAQAAGDGRFRVTLDGRTIEVHAELLPDGRIRFVDLSGLSGPHGRAVIAAVTREPRARVTWVSTGGVTARLVVADAAGARGGRDAHGSLEAPMPGKVVRVHVAEGDLVVKGQTLVAVEAMKMEHALKAPRAGRVTAVRAQLGELVQPGTPLVTLGDEA
jgi:biotin carboxyl carrier protein